MSTKLTLTIEKSVIQKAKEHASSHGRSLSDIVENYLKVIVSDDTKEEPTQAPIAKSLRGAFKFPDELDYKTELVNQLAKKYLNEDSPQ